MSIASEPAREESFMRLPRGTHLCHFHRGPDELLAATLPFLRAGLESGERCLFVASDPAMVAGHLGGEQVEIVDVRAWRGDAGPRCREALAAGYRGLRVAADTACAGGPSGDVPHVALCSYPIDLCTARGLLDILHAHPRALIRQDDGGWTEVDTGLVWARDDVVSLVSHELKTPLASLRLRIEGLLRKVRASALDPEEVAVRLAKALEQCDRLDALVTNLLDASRASAGPLQVLLEPGDLGSIVRDTAERFSEEAGHRGGTLTVVAEPIPGEWDRTRIEQMVTNLVGNALRHAPGAPVEVRASREAGIALIEVRDGGPGIDPDRVGGIFDRFATGRGGGLGIGLWLVRAIASALGGTVVVATEPGRGTVFTVALPRRDSLPAEVPA